MSQPPNRQDKDMQQRSKSNIRMAIILGVVALGFFVMGLYLAMGGPA